MSDLLTQKRASFSRDRTLRFTLERRWADLPVCCYIGHNPSDAGEEKEDPTSHAFMHFARVNGCGAYITVNQYPFIHSNPAECRKWAEEGWDGVDYAARDAMHENLDVVARVAKSCRFVVACWGAIAQDLEWTEEICEAVTSGEEPWPDLFCLGKTLSGAPKHPLARGKHRIARDQKFIIWRNANALDAITQGKPRG